MSEDLLATLRGSPAPRDEMLCKRLAGRLEQTWGFIAYGVLWVFVANFIGFLPAAGYGLLLDRLGAKNGAAFGIGMMLLYLAGFVLAWVAFAAWVKRKRGRARALFRDGEFTDGSVKSVQHIYIRGAEVTRIRIDFSVDGKAAHAIASVGGHGGLAEGAPVPILFVRDYRYCVAFAGGALTPATFHC